MTRDIDEDLWVSAKDNDLEEVEKYLKMGANPNYLTTNRLSPITMSANRYDTKMLQLMLKYNGDINLIDGKGYTPLIYASINCREDIVKLLLENGADVNYQYCEGYEMTTLHQIMDIASYDGTRFIHNNILELLINNGANKDLLDKEGKTALDYAKEHKNEDAIDFLTGGFKKALQERNAQFYEEVNSSNIEAVKELITQGIDIDFRKNGIKNPPLSIAIRQKTEESLKMSKLLIENGADVNFVDPHSKMSYIHLLLPTIHRNTDFGKEKFQLLLKHGANINLQDNLGFTPLDFVSELNATEAIDYIKKYGAKTSSELGL